MRTLEELTNTETPGWDVVKEWIASAKNKVEVLPCKRLQAEQTLVQIQASTQSLMGAIIYETGGLLIDNGWIRILGSGCEQMNRSLASWNNGKTFTDVGEAIAPYLLVADDAVGGFYALNGGGLGKDVGMMYYNSPDSLEWENLDTKYSQFLLFCFKTDLHSFYSSLRWNGWEDDVKELHPDYAYSFYPFLWTKQGENINKVSRAVIPVEEVYNFLMEMKTSASRVFSKGIERDYK